MLPNRLALFALGLANLLITTAAIAATPDIDIPFEKFVLENGLTVLVHEDHKTPIVAVGVWYHVGSKDEPEGKTGFAHLFEHIMFEGSEHFDRSFSTPLERVGATSLNGTTWLDRTNFFENVPTPALELALWLESDRMGYLLGAVTQEKLDRERNVIRNEKREADDQPYGKVTDHILAALFPPGHPYRHPTIGSVQDLDTASLEDVRTWFKNYYGAANTVLVLAGDITPERGKRLANRYFGEIPPGPPVSRLKAWVPEREYSTLEVLNDAVPQARSYRVWAVPGWTHKDRLLLQLAASILGDGKSSRLYQSLVAELDYAVSVSAEIEPFELASLFSIDTTLAQGIDTWQVNEIIEQELSGFLRDGPGQNELDRAKTRINAGIIRGLEHVGGFSGKATTLAQGELYDGNPAFYKTALSWIDNATTAEVLEVSRRWLANGMYQLDVLPFPDYRATRPVVDRMTGPPRVGKLPDIVFPEIRRARLSNGLTVVLAERTAIPVVSLSMQFDAGSAADFDGNAGTAGLTFAMMKESTRSRSALEMEQEAESLGAEISSASSLDTSSVSLSALKQNLEPSIELFADAIRNPAFLEDELQQQRTRWLAGIEREKTEPVSLALRTLPPLIYGEGHAYGIPFTGTGTEQSVNAITRDDLVVFYRDRVRPDNATLFVAGDTTLEKIIPLLETHFGNWPVPENPVPAKNITEVPLPARSRVIIIDRPGSQQSMILAAHVAPPSGAEDNLDIVMMNDVIGGTFSARVNQNLRADKQWSYGAFTVLPDAQGQRPWIVYAPVQADRTAESVRELLKELRRFVSDEPASAEELTRVYRSRALSLPGRFETSMSILEALQSNQRYGRPDDYISSLKEKYGAVELEDIREAARRVLHPESLTWVIVGDRAQIEDPLEALGIAGLEFMNAQGELID